MRNNAVKKLVAKVFNTLTHLYGVISRKYYWEDFVRVYPNGILINRFGKRITARQNDINNQLNHQKFYKFAAQFAANATVADIGCGSGYGCALLKNAGATCVCGIDASKHAIRFAKEHYGNIAEFSVHGVTNMKSFLSNQFDLAICSEVLEHIKEYGKEDQAVEEIKRITRSGGIIIIGTPNSELLGNHGFSFEEIETLIRGHFVQYCIFENALIPFGSSRELWERRLADDRTGVVVNQAINMDEMVLMNGEIPLFKKGKPAGLHRIGSIDVDTTLLHNTHSWAVVAIKNPV